MNTKEHTVKKERGSAEVEYLGQSVDQMILDFMREQKIPGLTLAIVQAPYIPRIVGYGLSDAKQKRLSSANTMYPIGSISQAFAAVAVMQLVEDGKLSVNDTLKTLLPETPQAWAKVSVLQLLRHSSGIADYRQSAAFNAFREWKFAELVKLASERQVEFAAGTAVRQSATNFLLLTEIVERVSGQSYKDFVRARQIDYLGLRHTGFADETQKFAHEDVAQTSNVHHKFKAERLYIDPIESAQSYDAAGKPVGKVTSSALKGFSDLWASAGDVSFWDIGLAGSVLIHKPENRAMVYAPWKLPNGQEIPAVAGWQFYKHRGLMDIKGSVPGYSAFLSRFTHSEELVCVTLLANKEGVDFTNLGRRIAGAFGDLLSTNYDDNKLFLYEGQFSAAETVARLEAELKRAEIPLFAKFDHAENAKAVGLNLRPTTVLVFGSPKTGTALMQSDQSIALELPLKIAVWEDEAGSTWLAFEKMRGLAAQYGMEQSPVIEKMELLLEDLVRRGGSIY